MKLFEQMEAGNYEQLILCQDKDSGLKAIICIHDTTLGPGLGGTRYWEYETEEEAIIDAIRLAKAMTYKNAAAGLELGGAKTVIMKDPNRPKDEAQMKAFGRFIEGLAGRYITAEDVGTVEQDMDWIYSETDYVVGTNMKPGTSGNPSPVSGHGVYVGIKATAKAAFGSDSLEGKSILVQGLGNVGYTVVQKALEEGATAYAFDINEDYVKRAVDAGAIAVSEEEVYSKDVDIFSPCALGAIINDETIPQLKAKVVAGSANNQLAEPRHGDALHEKGIVYAPDFIINAGGVINVADELYGGYNAERAMKKVEGIYGQLEKVFAIAEEQNIPTYKAADIMAEERINSVRQTRKIFAPNSNNILSGI